MDGNETTEQRILSAALELFFRQGIKKTNLEEVAHRAGVTRITVYRYFTDKHGLAEAAFMRIPAIIAEVQANLDKQPSVEVETVLDEIGQQLASMPSGDFPALLDELQRVYPDIWQRVHADRLHGIEMIFNHLFSLAEEQGRLRSELNRAVVQAYFLRAVVTVLEDPNLVAQGLSAAEVFSSVKAIFLHGILKEG